MYYNFSIAVLRQIPLLEKKLSIRTKIYRYELLVLGLVHTNNFYVDASQLSEFHISDK
jgi:hypothetical protein